MKVLVIGGGGREHALLWKLKQSPKVTALYCAPGNGGTGSIAENIPVEAGDTEELFRFAKQKRIDLTVVGPEVPLVMGIVDRFERDGMRIFGPSRLAAELEGSKRFAKHFMKKYSIPTAGFRTFGKDEYDEVKQVLFQMPPPVVIKADGLAAGKGVLICRSAAEADAALDEIFIRKNFGNAANTVIVEEFMAGEEASLFVLTDGEHYRVLSPAQDHKQILDGDRGKNTGGMGAYAPAPIVTDELLQRIEKEIIAPTLQGMNNEGRTYKGCLYIGLMITPAGPKVVEYNCRFGDPEAQVVLPLIDGDLFEIFSACSNHSLHLVPIGSHKACAVCVVMASRGYPDAYERGKEISGLEAVNADDGAVVFHAGTEMRGSRLYTAGGRVLGVTAIGYSDELEKIIANAYNATKKIMFDGAYYRSDIGYKGLRQSS